MLELGSLKKAIDSLEKLLFRTEEKEIMKNLDKIMVNGLRAGVIQNFEFTYEISWKYMKRWLEINIGSSLVDGVSRRHLFRLAIEHHLINDVDTWMDYHIARNKTSHTYNEDTAEYVYNTAKKFLVDVKIFYEVLDKKND